jgi:5-methylcytosine-specific restriction endonuclease McrA
MIPNNMRELVAIRDGHRCARCNVSILNQPSSVHHRKPREWAALFDGIPEVVLALDNDDAGREGAARIAEAFAAAGRDGIKSVQWPDGVKDANEYLAAGLGGKGVAL